MRSTIAVLAIAALLVACSDDDDEPRAQSVTTTTTTEGTSTTSTTSAADEPCELTTEPAGQGASVDLVAVLCDGERLDLAGQPAELPFGGTVTHGEGLRCDGDRLTVLTATSDDGVTYAATAVTYEADDGDLVEVDRETSTIDANTQPEVLDPYYRNDC